MSKATYIDWSDVEGAAQALAGNWQEFECFVNSSFRMSAAFLSLAATVSSTCLLSFFQGEIVGRLPEAVVLLHNDLVIFAEKVDMHLAPGLAGQTSPLHQFCDHILLFLLRNAAGTETERSGLME